MSFKERQIDVVKSIINSDWTDKSIIIHNKITDIRQLIELVDEEKFYQIDDIAVEIETISGISLGNEQEIISTEKKVELDQYLDDMKKFLESYTLQEAVPGTQEAVPGTQY